jgi:hypothetical protein
LEQELRDRLLAITDEKAAKIGVDGLHGFFDQVCTIFEKLGQYLAPMRTRDGLVATLDSVELTEEEQRIALGLAEHFGHFIRETVTALVDLGIKDLPPVPSGRKRVLTSELARKINAYVLHIYETNVDLKVCKKRAAQKFAVSYTTVQRAWSNRGRMQSTASDANEVVEYVRKKLLTSWLVADASILEVARQEYESWT